MISKSTGGAIEAESSATVSIDVSDARSKKPISTEPSTVCLETAWRTKRAVTWPNQTPACLGCACMNSSREQASKRLRGRGGEGDMHSQYKYTRHDMTAVNNKFFVKR